MFSKLRRWWWTRRLHVRTAQLFTEYAYHIAISALVRYSVTQPALDRVLNGVDPRQAFDGISPEMGMYVTMDAYFFLFNVIFETCHDRGIDDDAAVGIAVHVLRYGMKRTKDAAIYITEEALDWREQVMISRGDSDGTRDETVETDAFQSEIYEKSLMAARRVAMAEGEDQKPTWEERDFFFECCGRR